MEENINESVAWDKFDYIFAGFRFAIFAIVLIGSGYFAYNGFLFFNSGGTTIGWIVSILYLALWIFFLIGVASYLIFFTRNTFRMYYEPIPDDEDDEDDEDEDKQAEVS